MTSAAVDTTTAVSAIYVHFYTQHNGVEAGESLSVEYQTQLGVWKPLTTVVSDGINQSNFVLTQLALPFDAYGGNTALRFTANSNESNDAWYLDEVAITTEIIVEQTCPADLTDDGMLNFFDVSAFLSAFSQGCP